MGLRTPVESYMRVTEVAFKVGGEALFPTSTRAQRMPSRPTSSLLGLGLGLGSGLGSGLGLGSPSWFTRSVLQQLFRSQGREKILAAASSSSKQQQASSKQATELISAYPHISISIDGISPKLSWYIVLMMLYNHTKFWVKTHQGAGSVGKKV